MYPDEIVQSEGKTRGKIRLPGPLSAVPVETPRERSMDNVEKESKRDVFCTEKRGARINRS